jgi:hypothetical protein
MVNLYKKIMLHNLQSMPWKIVFPFVLICKRDFVFWKTSVDERIKPLSVFGREVNLEQKKNW